MSGRSRMLDVGYRTVLRPALFRTAGGDAERVHERTLRMIARLGGHPAALRVVGGLVGRPADGVTVAGIRFPGPVGLAAGMDKNGIGVQAWGALGFSHAELGTVTARPQPGNPRPRLFRLRDSRAIINRMGFNNDGAQALADRLDTAGVRRGNNAVGIPVGISIGKTKSTPLAEATADYLSSLRLLAPRADYVAVNVSSPNTPGLRSLQDKAALAELLGALTAEARLLAAADPAGPVPIFVKIAPDLTETALDEVLTVCHDSGIQGLIATNTTLSRDGLAPSDRMLGHESGGLSGAPLTVRARTVVRHLTSQTTLPVIGVGGILTAADGQAMLDAGASLLQVYTGYIFRGPALTSELNQLTVNQKEIVR
nr:quinone-dependent dihydroorotate dehydrogenase [Microlunatus panaciterrae]